MVAETEGEGEEGLAEGKGGGLAEGGGGLAEGEGGSDRGGGVVTFQSVAHMNAKGF